MRKNPTESNLSVTDAYDCWIEKHLLSRRQAIGLAVLTASSFASAATLAAPSKLTFSKASEDEISQTLSQCARGKRHNQRAVLPLR